MTTNARRRVLVFFSQINNCFFCDEIFNSIIYNTREKPNHLIEPKSDDDNVILFKKGFLKP